MTHGVRTSGDCTRAPGDAHTGAYALVAALGALLAAAPLLGIYFHDDDFLHLFQLMNFGPREFITAPYAGHMHLVRNSVFYLTFLLFGMHAAAYFASVVVTHVANVLLLFALVRRLTASARVACFGALLFAICPANDGALAWYSVFGHALAATFVLAALLLLTPRRDDGAPLSTRRAVGVACCMLAASQSFGTGVAATALTPLVAALLRPSAFRNRGAAAALLAVPVLVVVAMAALYLPRTHINTDPMTMVGLLARSAADWRDVLSMIGHILSLGIVSLTLGSAYSLDRYPDAFSAAATAIFALGALWTFWRGSPRTRRELLAFLALALGCYAMVAVGRAAFLAGIQPAALVHAYVAATRYHYLAQTMLAVVLCLVLAEVAQRLPLAPRTTGALLAAWVVWELAATLLLRPSAPRFDAVRDLVGRQREAITNAVLAQPAGATVCLPNEALPVSVGFPGSVGVFMLFHDGDTLEGRRVYFTSSDPGVLAMRGDGGRLRALLLPADSCPPRAG
jgi:hypothetical protein